VRELTRVAVAETAADWLAAARGKTIRQLEELVANKSPGDTPEGPGLRPRARVLRFEVAPETFALFRDAMRELRRAAGGGLDDDAVLLSMARQVLAGPGDEGRASYQVSLAVCGACGRGDQLGGGEVVPVGDEVVAMAECDGQHIGQLLPRPEIETGASDVAAAPPANDVHVGAPALASESSGDAAADASATRAAAPASPIPRAKQSIPPAVRRAVLARDRHRCRIPGCRHTTFLDIHHLVPRSDGGSNDPANIITICSAHHRANHRGQLIIEPDGDESPRFRHADGSTYGYALAPRVVDAHAKVFAGLRHLGFRERDVKAVLAELLADDELRDATAERLLREALCRIRSTR
jgi:hypothetical protein